MCEAEREGPFEEDRESEEGGNKVTESNSQCSEGGYEREKREIGEREIDRE